VPEPYPRAADPILKYLSFALATMGLDCYSAHSAATEIEPNRDQHLQKNADVPGIFGAAGYLDPRTAISFLGRF
jgi:hypothetical protein